MTQRIDIGAASPETYKALARLEHSISVESGLPHRLIHLIKLRASILNGCAYCVDMHVKEARRDGLGEQWINLVSVWREARVYSELERTVLAWTDAVTLLAKTQAPDGDFDPLRAHFSEADIAKMTVAIGMINLWNRLAVGLRMPHPLDALAQAA